MKEKLDPGPLDVALDNAPEFSAQVGVLLSCFALIERYLPQLVSKITGMSEDEALLFVGSFHNVSGRIDLIDTLLKKKQNLSPAEETVKSFIPRLREVSTIRNRYAHAQFSYMKPDKFQITSFLSSATKETKVEVHTFEDVKKKTFYLKELINDMHGFVYRNEMKKLS